MTGILEWIIFLALSLIAVITAAGMLLTMSRYRARLALMASFVALAGLFILLGADLLAAIQIMMNVGAGSRGFLHDYATGQTTSRGTISRK